MTNKNELTFFQTQINTDKDFFRIFMLFPPLVKSIFFASIAAGLSLLFINDLILNFSFKAKRHSVSAVPQTVEKPEIQANWISGFNCLIIKIVKYENTEEHLS